MLSNYDVGDLHFPEMNVDERRTNDRGRIVVGGDMCDVHATSAAKTANGVILYGVQIATSGKLGQLSKDEREDMARLVVEFCYRSIGKDTFLKTRE